MNHAGSEARGTGELEFRADLRPSDRKEIERIVRATGFFHDAEVLVAVELVDARLQQGAASGYHFIMAESAGRLCGYACYGPIACTVSSFDLFWIVVDPEFQGHGLGRRLIAETEHRIRELGGTRVYAETSNRPLYAPTRTFYTRCRYRTDAILADFYAPGDDKVVFVKVLGGEEG